jgi:hypothetical protein
MKGRAVEVADESHSVDWKLQIHCNLSASVMSADMSQVGVALFPPF